MQKIYKEEEEEEKVGFHIIYKYLKEIKTIKNIIIEIYKSKTILNTLKLNACQTRIN